MNDPLILALAANLIPLEAEAPPSALQAAAGGSFSLTAVVLVPALLLLVGALAGGLRTLLASPLRKHLLAQHPGKRRDRLLVLAESHPTLATVAGLVRVVAVFAAVVLMVEGTAGATPVARWASWIGLTLLGGLLLEGASSLALHGRGLAALTLVLPLVRLLELPLRPLAGLMARFVRDLGAGSSGGNGYGLAVDMLDVAQKSEREDELGEAERRMIGRIMELPDTDAAEVMTPRTSLVALPASATLSEALEISVKEGHSRIPVYDHDIDHVTGVLFIKDVLPQVLERADFEKVTVRELMREPFFVPETMKVPALFEEMRRRRLHLAVALDEYGGTAGVVTVEDMLEEIVGDIRDEHDPEASRAMIERVGPGELLVDGGLGVAELNEAAGIELPDDDDFDTVAGLIFDRFGHVPARGETLQENGVTLEVIEADDRRIHRVRVRLQPAPADSDAA